MKLLYCQNCQDAFKLSMDLRTCACGEVKGRYINNSHAETNGKGVDIAIGNGSLQNAIADMTKLFTSTRGEADRDEYYKAGSGLISHAWVRPITGNGNPHTTINVNL